MTPRTRSRGSVVSRAARRARLAALAGSAFAALLASACAWYAWTPERGRSVRESATEPAARLDDLALGAPRVDTLACYAPRCQRRFRLVVPEPGRLTVSAVAEIASSDDGMTLVLETTRGVLVRTEGRKGPGAGPTRLAVGDAVDPGLHFVLVQSFGGPIPYQLTARLEPETRSSAPSGRAAPAAWSPPPGPPPRLVAVELPGNAAARFDPAVSFDEIRTFAFPEPLTAEEARAAGLPLEQPVDREIRRLLVEELRMKHLRQARGGETPDAIVDFTRRRQVRADREISLIYDWYELDPAFRTQRGAPDARGTLTVDIVETRSRRIAWHAWTTKGLGPGITPGERSRALLREAVADVLSRFPPR